MNKYKVKYLMVITVLLTAAGCKHTTYNARRTPGKELQREGSVVFVRPDKYTTFGTRSIRDYIEVAYEQLTINNAGLAVLTVGLRNRGGQHFWDKTGGSVQLSVQTAFYKSANKMGGVASVPPVYRTNWQVVKLVRGQTSDYKVVCPVPGAKYYQVTISEFLTR